MQSFTVLEWNKLNYGSEDGKIPEPLADQLAALAQKSSFAGKGGSGVLEHGRHALRARGVVGILATQNCSLEILPKIEVVSDGSPIQQNAAIRKRLIHMLAVAYNLKIDLGSITELDWQRETLLEILVRIFCEKLTKAVRKGMPRRYVEQTGDLYALRGRLDVVRQFSQFAFNPSRLACQFDALSEDTGLNRTLKAAVTYLSRTSRSQLNQQRLRELSLVYADVTDVPPSVLTQSKVVIDRTNRQWSELLDIALLFLRGRYQTTTGGAGQGTALLFEMNTLFEDYVGRLIRRAVVGTDLTVALQGGRKYCLSADNPSRGHFLTKPDILIRRGNSVVHVIDTKWKRISSRIDDQKQGVKQSDVYQMIAYAHLYKTPRLTLLYPHHKGLGEKELVHARHKITGHDGILETASIDVADGANIIDRLGRLLELDEITEVNL